MVPGPVEVVVVLAAAVVALLLVQPRVRASDSWRATVTPLASIIGSGFLIVTPLLALTVGRAAPLAMAAVVVLSLWIGSALRCSILVGEPRLAEGEEPLLRRLDELSRGVLGLAYVVSVAFYLRLMASFVAEPFGDGQLAERLVTTAVLVAIGVVGMVRGLHGMETVEEFAVGLKLAVIAGLLAGLVAVVVSGPPAGLLGTPVSHAHDPWHVVRVLAGTLLVVQGFETSRYLGRSYDATLRARTMTRAQLLAGGIYLAFVVLSVPLLGELPERVDETAVLGIARAVSVVLVPMLLAAAVASQLSAAVADTAGGGEMLGGTRVVRSHRVGYLVVLAAALVLVWTADVFAVAAYASRAFAAYYLVQTVGALILAWRAGRRGRALSYAGLACVLAFVVVFALPLR